MKIIQQDLLEITSGYICHSCNCKGRMGGLAGAIKAKYPIVFIEYLKYLQGHNTRREALGTIQYVPINSDLTVINMFGQFGYGRRNPDSMTDYNALTKIANELGLLSLSEQSKLYMPYMIGCGMGGGDWARVQDIFKDINGHYCKLD
jgi:O-acetyl-ADP-ribose deacetylase (regulator of RNase III)